MPAIHYEDGVLYLSTPLARMRLRWHPAPLAEELPPGGRRYRAFWPEFRLLRPETVPARRASFTLEPNGDTTAEAAVQKAAAFAAFRSGLPPALAAAVERFGSHQWPLLLLLHRQPRALDLAQANPVLAYALANSNEFSNARIEAAGLQAVSHSHGKQRAILAWLGFPGTEGMARLMRKIEPESASPMRLRLLRNAMAADKSVFDRLAGLPSINGAVLELAANSRLLELAAPKLLMELATRGDATDDISTGEILLEALAILQRLEPARVLRPFERLSQVRRFRVELDAEYQEHVRRREAARRREVQPNERRRHRAETQGKQRPFPAPPIAGSATIVPITDMVDLEVEGMAQNNCVDTYGPYIQMGSLYIYRVLTPERATLSIVRGADGCWRRSELKGKGNRKVTRQTADYVEAWLTGHSVSVV